MIKLQNIGPDEWELWKHQRLAALTEAPYAFKSKLEEWEDAPEKRWRDRLSIPGAYFLIAFLDGTGVGMAGGSGTEEVGVATLTSFWVAPTARGRGVGDALITAIEEWARGAGFAKLRLGVMENNQPARNFYLRNGFVAADLEYEEPNDVCPVVVMLKELR